MYAAIRQAKAKAGVADELSRRVKEGAIPIVSEVPGFLGYYVVYGADDTVTTISLFNDHDSAEESNRRMLDWIGKNVAPLLEGAPKASAGTVIVHTVP